MMIKNKSFVILNLLFLLSVLVGFFDVTLMLIALILSSVCVYFFVFKNKYLFDAFFLYSIYYYSLPLTALVLYLSDFEGNSFYESQSFYSQPNHLLNIALLYVLIGYVFSLIGYKISGGGRSIEFNVDKCHYKRVVVFAVSLLFALLGLFNFIANIMMISGGNIFAYVASTAIRKSEFQELHGTTVLYIFSYSAAYILYHWSLQVKRTKTSFFVLMYIYFTIFMMSTNGRITATIMYGLSFVALNYFSTGGFKNNNKYIVFILALIPLGVIMYLARLLSSLNLNGLLLDGLWDGVLQFANFDLLKHFVIDKGNVPNIPVLMKIIDVWGYEIDYLKGGSIVSQFFLFGRDDMSSGFLPVSVIVKNNWYTLLQGGNLPPTGIGEMYANFGILGPVIGMFFYGVFIGLLKSSVNKFNNYWFLLLYIQISLNFAFFYAKGEFDNISLFYVFISFFPPLIMLIANLLLKGVFRYGNGCLEAKV